MRWNLDVGKVELGKVELELGLGKYLVCLDQKYNIIQKNVYLHIRNFNDLLMSKHLANMSCG